MCDLIIQRLNMRTLLKIKVEPSLLCLVTILLTEVHMTNSMTLGYAYHFKETGGAHLTNEEGVLRIPPVYRLLRGLNVTRQEISSGNAVTFIQNSKNVNVEPSLGRHPMLNVHEMLHRMLNARVYHGQDSHLSTKFQSSDSDEQKGSFKISDKTVSGKGEYAVSSGQKNVEIKMKLRINTQQNHHHQQNQQQTPTPTMASTRSRFTTPQMCVVPCNTKLEPQAANCIPTQFEQEALNIHNRYRAIHNSPAMTLNCQMSKDAAAYAQKLAEMDTLVKSSYKERPEQGENLSLGCYKDREETAEEAIKMWFDEVCQYTFGKQGPQPGTSHFTQLAWKKSSELGIGKASNKQSDGTICTYVVARYKPQGDIERGDDSYRKNIEKGSFVDSYCKNIKKAGLDGGYGFKRFKDS